MNGSGNGKSVVIFMICAAIVIVLGGYFTLFTDDTPKEKDTKVQGYKTKESALTLKEDKDNASAQAEENESKKEDKKKEESKKDKSKDKSKDKKKESLKKTAKENGLTTLKILDKPKSEYNKESTQELFKNVATKEFVENHSSNNKDDKVVTYKNVSIDISDKDLEKSKVKGNLKMDRLTKPKNKKSSVKPSTEIDYKMVVSFKKEGDSLKVEGIQS